MAVNKGRSAVILVATTSPGVTAVSQATDPSLSEDIKTADKTTNDSGAAEEHGIISSDGSLSFKFLTDEADAGQNILRDAAEGLTQIYVRYRPYGTGSGKRQYDCLCSVSLKRGSPRDGYATTDATLKKTGAWTIANQ